MLVEKISISSEDEVNNAVVKSNVGKEMSKSSILINNDEDGKIKVDTSSLKVWDGSVLVMNKDGNREVELCIRSLYPSKLLYFCDDVEICNDCGSPIRS